MWGGWWAGGKVGTDRLGGVRVGRARLLRRRAALHGAALVALLAGQAAPHAPIEVVRALALHKTLHKHIVLGSQEKSVTKDMTEAFVQHWYTFGKIQKLNL